MTTNGNGTNGSSAGFRLGIQILGVVLALLGMTAVPAITTYIALNRTTAVLDNRMDAVEREAAEIKLLIIRVSDKTNVLEVADERKTAQMATLMLRLDKSEQGLRELAKHLLEHPQGDNE